MALSKELIEKWGGGTVILSPRDLKRAQMLKFSNELKRINGKLVLDPQFYLPRANHQKLTAHSFWPNNFNTVSFTRDGVSRMLQTIKNDYIDPLDVEFFITPSMFSSDIDDDWYNLHELLIDNTLRIIENRDIYHTLSLSSDLLRDEGKIHTLLEYLENWDVKGYYVVAEPYKNSYLVEDPVWITNLLDLCAGIKRLGKKVIVGYSNHQDLYLSLAKVDAIATGTFLNTRRFNPAKFRQAEEDQFSRKTTWYYCPQALSEYQIPFLDMAHRVGVLDRLRPDAAYQSSFADMLFSGAQPTSTNFSERFAFRHYIQCLKYQVETISRSTYIETKTALKIQLETAISLTSHFREMGIRGKDRDFLNVAEVNLAAIDQFHHLRGMIFEQVWDSL